VNEITLLGPPVSQSGSRDQLVSDLPDGAALAAALFSNARRVATPDLALALLDTKMCRQVAGLPV
jgi:hypothetical protein